jgi:hypothetical protein
MIHAHMIHAHIIHARLLLVVLVVLMVLLLLLLYRSLYACTYTIFKLSKQIQPRCVAAHHYDGSTYDYLAICRIATDKRRHAHAHTHT